MKKIGMIVAVVLGIFILPDVRASSAAPGDTCGAGMVYDCVGNCVDESTARSWIGDGYCDDGSYGMDLRCPEFDCDGGDCGYVCGSSGGSNTKYYGAFYGKETRGNCTQMVLVTVGNDIDRIGDPDYFYLPSTGDFFSYEGVDEDGDPFVRTIIKISDTKWVVTEVGQWEDDPSHGWAAYGQYKWSKNYNKVKIKGNTIDDDPTMCQGKYKAKFTRQ